ncbi:zinc-ribbon domain-containing protein [Chloroflexus aggregans]|uniref:FHA domain containing protein n=1 Tax=Chloroflexus aggregans (strain MD-66 / DSM 9485) TaxID=326427 RepID=B8G547_CHLAD|nr:zinc-ribbon domain-containing protein [Chloroflexus aggregans]ACL23680.1 FHA domain containing protein [Chloroflexus aggregans DSM 9485]
MIICPSCGAQNEPTNRFCDQCGTRLVNPTPMTVSPDQPTALAPSCPVCGATVLPGERFCDNCGADLLNTPAAPSIPSDQATLIAPPDAPQLFCPSCGDPVLPGERFCDHCGADLSHLTAPSADAPTVIAPPAPEPPAPPSADAPTVIAPPAPEPPAPPSADAPTVIAPPAPEPPAPPSADAPTVIAPPAPEPPAPPSADAPTVIAPPAPEPPAPPIDIPTVSGTASIAEPVAPAVGTAPFASAAPPPPGDWVAERARLETLLAAHRDTVAQYEQMAARYPAGSVPAFILAGLDAARAELAKTEAELAALPSGPDPAEVARLEALLAAHRDTVAQYEQMAARYPAGSVPAFILAGLDAARAELAKTEAELTALIGNAPPSSTPIATPNAHPSAPTPLGTPIVNLPQEVACLVLADGSEIILPPGKTEYVIGREDPVSNIFPEIDLTPYGGELGGVSRQHAKIVHVGNQWSIIDLNSTNHTRVNGNRIEPQTPVSISNGTKLQFGRLVATFQLKTG